MDVQRQIRTYFPSFIIQLSGRQSAFKWRCLIVEETNVWILLGLCRLQGDELDCLNCVLRLAVGLTKEWARCCVPEVPFSGELGKLSACKAGFIVSEQFKWHTIFGKQMCQGFDDST